MKGVKPMVFEMKRLAGYLPDPVYDYLEKWSHEESRSLSSLVGFILERAVRDRQTERGEAMAGETVRFLTFPPSASL